MSRYLMPLGVAMVTAATAIGLQAQQPTFRAASNLVAVYATVRDARGQLVRGLTPEDFEVRENGQLREIAAFSNDVQPITLSMILDRSGSLLARSKDVTEGATRFFDALLPGDRVALGSLTWDCVPLTGDLPRLRRTVESGMMMDLGSPIWESIDRAFFAMENEVGRRAILIFSDGANVGAPPTHLATAEGQTCQPARTATGATVREVAERAERNGVLVYAIGVDAMGQREDGDLRNIARDTGGELFRMKQGESLVPVFARIAEELHSQYLLGFVPAAGEGRSARIDVRVKGRGLNVRARRSFSVAPNAPIAVNDAPEVTGPLSDAAVEAAIRDGHAGRSIRAACSARAGGSAGFFDVVLEGPTARIMRAAKEARQRGEAFTLNDVTPGMRAATVRVVATGRTPVLADAEAEEVPAPVASGLRLRGLGPRPRVLEPTLRRLRSGPFEVEFPLPGVRALGSEIEVIVPTFVNTPKSAAVDARCRLNATALAQLR